MVEIEGGIDDMGPHGFGYRVVNPHTEKRFEMPLGNKQLPGKPHDESVVTKIGTALPLSEAKAIADEYNSRKKGLDRLLPWRKARVVEDTP